MTSQDQVAHRLASGFKLALHDPASCSSMPEGLNVVQVHVLSCSVVVHAFFMQLVAVRTSWYDSMHVWLGGEYCALHALCRTHSQPCHECVIYGLAEHHHKSMHSTCTNSKVLQLVMDSTARYHCYQQALYPPHVHTSFERLSSLARLLVFHPGGS